MLSRVWTRTIALPILHRHLTRLIAMPHQLEPGIITDLRDRLTYTGYLCLDTLLGAQKPLSGSASTPFTSAGSVVIMTNPAVPAGTSTKPRA